MISSSIVEQVMESKCRYGFAMLKNQKRKTMQDRAKVIEIVFISLDETGVLLCLATYVMMSHASSDYAD